MNRLSANNTKLYLKNASGEEFTELEYLMEIPEFGGAAEKIDVTVLSDSIKHYTNGIIDMSDLVFKFLYDNSSATSNYRVLKDLQDSGKPGSFKLTYPDGTSHTFDAGVSVKMDAGAVNGALTFSCTMAILSDITVENPAA